MYRFRCITQRNFSVVLLRDAIFKNHNNLSLLDHGHKSG